MNQKPYTVPTEVPTLSFRRDGGGEVFVYAKRYAGEPGSLSVPPTVEITRTTDATGRHVEITDEEFAAAQREAERLLA